MNDPVFVKESLTLSDIIGQSVKLKRSSGNSSRFIGLCPFHNDRNPSFCVDDSWGRYRCFSCGAKGDLFQYLQDSESINFKEAVDRAKVMAGIVDEYMTPVQRSSYERKAKAAAEERVAFRKWKEEVRSNLIAYTSLEWEIYRKAKRQLLDTWTEEMTEQSELAYSEATRKEMALDDLESMTDQELIGFYRSRKVWEGVANPPWFLSGRRLELVKKSRAA